VEAAFLNIVSGTLDDELIVELEQSAAHVRNAARGFVDNVKTAEFQADSFIMGRVLNGSTLMVQTSDSDIPAISSDNCIAIKEFTKEGNMQIVSTSAQTIKKAMEFLTDTSREHVTYTPAKYPIFEGVEDRRLHALLAIFLGCDVCVKGLPGVGAKKMNDIININFQKYSTHKFGFPVNNYTNDNTGSFKYKHIKYHNVPKYPPELKGKTRKQSIVHRQIKIFHRREMLCQMGLDADANKTTFRICENHSFAHETRWVNVRYGQKSWSERCKITLPANIGPKSTAIESNESSGLGTDRELK
jgi:hypothetical protein